MSKLYYSTPTPALNTQLPFELHTLFYIANIELHSFILTITSIVPISPTDTEKIFPSDDPNITNLMVSHYDCEKQQKLRQFNLLKFKQCTEAPSNIQHITPESML